MREEWAGHSLFESSRQLIQIPQSRHLLFPAAWHLLVLQSPGADHVQVAAHPPPTLRSEGQGVLLDSHTLSLETLLNSRDIYFAHRDIGID